jgi:glutamate mutase epsilon subunit
MSRPAELLTLEEAGIRSIALRGSGGRLYQDMASNLALRTLGFSRADGTSGTVYDVWFGLGFGRAPSDPRTSGIVSTLGQR